MDNGTVPTDIEPPETTTSDRPASNGGTQYLDWSLPATGLREDERGIIQALGGAVVARWSHLPRDVQKLLFETAARGPGTAGAVRGHIARFLHDNAYPEK